MGNTVPRFRAAYGSSPLHLAAMIGCFTLTGWVALRIAEEATAGRMLLWFVGAAVAHDLVLFPVYASADRVLRGALGRSDRTGTDGRPPDRHHPMPPRTGRAPARPSPLNHIRVPALATGLLFLVYLPGILRQGRETYLAATGQNQHPYLARWLALSVTLFLLSGGWYVVRRARWRRAGPR
ncbi:hypothetical protein O7614_10660 [Micromonospora sp. WMMD961]|uniref:hypothetical protein n=1 Tax=Micromonospora sp. WMMD961 TaxID=3016100 RepID=UPI00241710A8|nr:hypothetical protein [Micromonospora sp. WMMD961]MDG4780101.1 hypothetical protein [Micromonospora sp. WMMD961]